MNAAALRAQTPAGTPRMQTNSTTTAATAGASAHPNPVAGGGPVKPSKHAAVNGTVLLPAPAGQPKKLHLPDGSTLVPVARVSADGKQVPLRANGTVKSPVAAAARPASAPASNVVGGGATAATPVTGGGAFEPKGFLYQDNYYKKFHNAGGISLDDKPAVEERAVRSTLAYLLEEEPTNDNFGVRDVRVRRTDRTTDRALLTVNPNAHYVIDVVGTQGDGVTRSIPSVMNADGSVFVDPPVRRG